LILAVAAVFGILLLTFTMTHVIPGCPATIVAGPAPSPELIERIRTELGLDKPLHQQFFLYVERLSRFDLGVSLISRRPVAEDLWRFFPATVELAMVTIIVASILGISAGVVSAIRQNSPVDHVVRVVIQLGASMPEFFTGIMLQLFAFHFLIGFPLVGRVCWDVLTRYPLENITGLLILDSLLQGNIPVLLSALLRLILPVTTLALLIVVGIARMVRAEMILVMREDYIRTAKAMGVGQAKVVYKYALKNCLIPTVTIIGMLLGWLIGGAVVVEAVFAWPGIGRYLVTAIGELDFPIVMGVTVVASIAYIFLNLLVDLSYAVIDPRVRYD
jgi:peptide/nickel transport system permease protein